MKIDSYTKLIEVLTLQVANLPTYKSAVEASDLEITNVEEALANLNYLQDYSDLIDANKKTVFQIKKAAFNGDKNEPLTAFPVFPPAVPPNPLQINYLGDALERNRRWKTAAGYTSEIGTALGIEENKQSITPESVKPTVQITSAQTGFVYSVVVSNRANATMWDVYEMRKGDAGFKKIETFSGKSGDVHAAPTVPGNAEQFQVRVQLRKGNANYGQPSDIVLVTINP